MNTTLKEFSPEEKLLNLIENSEEKKTYTRKKSNKTGLSFLNFGFFLKGAPKTYKLIFVLCVAVIVFAGYNLGVKALDTMKFYDIKIGYQSKAGGFVPNQTKIDIRAGMPVKNTNAYAPSRGKKGLALVGILWTDRPQAIIEEASTNKTYIVYEGDTIKDYHVSRITQNQVELNSGNGNEILN